MDYVDVVKQREEMLQSYCDAIREVGGCPMHFLDKLELMTVREMIDVLAQNGVRFTTTKPPKPRSSRFVRGGDDESW